MKRNGFTLTETLIALLAATLVIFGIVTAYLNGISLMRKSGRQLWAQQKAIVAMNKVGDYVRASQELDVFDYIPPSTWTNADQGNFLVTYSVEDHTTAFYYVGNNMYCVPGFSQDEFFTDTKYLLVSDLKDDTYFLKDGNNIQFSLEITEPDDTNRTVFKSVSYFASRN